MCDSLFYWFYWLIMFDICSSVCVCLNQLSRVHFYNRICCYNTQHLDTVHTHAHTLDQRSHMHSIWCIDTRQRITVKFTYTNDLIFIHGYSLCKKQQRYWLLICYSIATFDSQVFCVSIMRRKIQLLFSTVDEKPIYMIITCENHMERFIYWKFERNYKTF